jgi:hypothetical protein
MTPLVPDWLRARAFYPAPPLSRAFSSGWNTHLPKIILFRFRSLAYPQGQLGPRVAHDNNRYGCDEANQNSVESNHKIRIYPLVRESWLRHYG